MREGGRERERGRERMKHNSNTVLAYSKRLAEKLLIIQYQTIVTSASHFRERELDILLCLCAMFIITGKRKTQL